MKKSSILALAAFSLFAYPMFAEETTETEIEETATVVETVTTVSFNDDETQENFIAFISDEEEEDTASA